MDAVFSFPKKKNLPAHTMPVVHKKIVAGAGSPGPCLLLSDYIVVIFIANRCDKRHRITTLLTLLLCSISHFC